MLNKMLNGMVIGANNCLSLSIVHFHREFDLTSQFSISIRDLFVIKMSHIYWKRLIFSDLRFTMDKNKCSYVRVILSSLLSLHSHFETNAIKMNVKWFFFTSFCSFYLNIIGLLRRLYTHEYLPATVADRHFHDFRIERRKIAQHSQHWVNI